MLFCLLGMLFTRRVITLAVMICCTTVGLSCIFVMPSRRIVRVFWNISPDRFAPSASQANRLTQRTEGISTLFRDRRLLATNVSAPSSVQTRYRQWTSFRYHRPVLGLYR